MRATRAVLITALAACGGSEPSKELSYNLYISNVPPGPDVHVLVAGKKLPLKSKHPVSIVLPPETPPILQSVTIELATPCGPKTVKLVAKKHVVDGAMTADVEIEARKPQHGASPFIEADLQPETELQPPASVHADLVGPAKLGALEIKAGTTAIHEPQCGPLQVTFANGTTATLELAKGTAFVITDQKQSCYQRATVRYGDAGVLPSSDPDVLRDAHVYAFDTRIDYFREAAPKTIASPVGLAIKSEVTKIPCP